MGEKVYGICGTNKCRKEVVPKSDMPTLYMGKDNIKVLNHMTKFVVTENKAAINAHIALPTGWNYMNTFIVSGQFLVSGSGATQHLIGAQTKVKTVTANISTDNRVNVTFEDDPGAYTDQDSVDVNIVVMKIS